jgi:hypothetical protein
LSTLSAHIKSAVTVLGVHFGAAVKSIANKYRGIKNVIPEAVQNALDANAVDVWVTVNHKNRTISVRDNGDGVSIDEFNAATGQKGKTYKEDDNAVGQFNEGFLSPLGKCDKFTFTSKSKDDNPLEPYNRWTLVSKDIFESDVPVELNPEPIEYRFARNRPKSDGPEWANWRSEMKMFKFTTTVPLDEHEILLECTRKYRGKMLRIGTTLHLTVIDKAGNTVLKRDYKAQKFAGKKLKDWKKVDGENVTRIELYSSSATDKSNPGIRVSSLKRPFDLPVTTLLDQETCSLLDHEKDLVSALKSNIFQGKIESNLLVLKSTRDGFEEDDRLLDFLEHLVEWWHEVGKTEYARLQSHESSEIFQNCAKKAQDAFRKLTEDPEIRKLLENLRRSKPIGIGDGLIAEADKHGDSVVLTGSEGPYETPEPTKRDPKTPPGKPGGKTWGIANGGTKAVTVSYRGLIIKESQELDSSTPWQIELASLTVFVNIEHQYYSRCYDVAATKREKAITDYQKKVLFQALSLVTSGFSPSDTEWLFVQEVLFQELLFEVLNITGVSR